MAPDKEFVSPLRVTGMLILTTFLWGGSFVFNKIAFREIPPVPFMVFRFALATLIMALICVRRFRGMDRETLRSGVTVGLALAAANLSFVLGVSGTTVSRAGFLNNLFVLLIPLLCYVRWKEKIDPFTLFGVMLAMWGLWELARGGSEGFSRGDMLSTICALFISLHIILVSRVLGDEDVYLVTLIQFATVSAVGGIVWCLLPSKPFAIGHSSLSAILYCAIFPTVICFTIQNTYQRFSTPTRAGLIYTLDPVWSMLGGMIFLGERLTGREAVGCSFIFAAVILPLLVKRMRERRPALSAT